MVTVLHLCIVAIGLLQTARGAKLAVQGDHLTLNGQKVFLSGGNLAWISYAYDYGGNRWKNYPRGEFEKQVQQLHAAGGNSMRVWIHMQGESSPAFDSNGFVTGMDVPGGSFLDDFKDMLNISRANDIIIIPCLWNGAVNQDNKGYLDGLIKDPAKLQSYIDNVLTPLVNAVKDNPAAGIWDIMNEPEGLLIPDQADTDPCFDTKALANSGAGWASRKYTFKEILRFVNLQAAAIKAADPQALVSVGVWNPKSNTDQFGFINHYKDECLVKAGGKSTGTLDIWQYHSYSWQGKFDEVAAFVHSAADYKETKPIVVGEFWTQDGGGMTITEMFDYVYNHGYSGAWSWDIHSHGEQRDGITHIKDYTNNGVIPIDI